MAPEICNKVQKLSTIQQCHGSEFVQSYLGDCIINAYGIPSLSALGRKDCYSGSCCDMQVLERANKSDYGLAAGVYSNNVDYINSLSRCVSPALCR